MSSMSWWMAVSSRTASSSPASARRRRSACSARVRWGRGAGLRLATGLPPLATLVTSIACRGERLMGGGFDALHVGRDQLVELAELVDFHRRRRYQRGVLGPQGALVPGELVESRRDLAQLACAEVLADDSGSLARRSDVVVALTVARLPSHPGELLSIGHGHAAQVDGRGLPVSRLIHTCECQASDQRALRLRHASAVSRTWPLRTRSIPLILCNTPFALHRFACKATARSMRWVAASRPIGAPGQELPGSGRIGVRSPRVHSGIGLSVRRSPRALLPLISRPPVVP